MQTSLFLSTLVEQIAHLVSRTRLSNRSCYGEFIDYWYPGQAGNDKLQLGQTDPFHIKYLFMDLS
jgi:hypothetical protein